MHISVKGKPFDSELNYELLFQVSILDLLTLSLIKNSFFWDMSQYSLAYCTSVANERSTWCSETTNNPHWFPDTQAKIIYKWLLSVIIRGSLHLI